MLKNQAQQIVIETLQNDFDKNRFLYFIKNLLNRIDETKVFKYSGAYISESFRPYVSAYERIGQYVDPENNKVDILIVYLQKETSLERARTAQRNFVARYLKDRDQKDAGLIAFVSPNPAEWRFSLVKMEYKFSEGKSGRVKVKEEFTPAKRWSFLVGKNENSHTAKSRLAPVMEDDQTNPTLKQLEDAFNIEKVTKEFFEKYRDLFLGAYETLNDVIKQHPDIKADFEEKNVEAVDFSKKLLGQIVFLYFLQKKGWFGVPMNKSWGEGDKKFLRTLFDEAASKSKNYFNDYLEPLFYEALAKERDDDFYSRFECKIPFLNGGLFDPINNYDWVNTYIDLPNELFSNKAKDLKTGDIGNGILDIFDRYNFTVKEDEPLEKEVAIDPEMLGKVFENLLEVKDRKSKGTYYTPREIVHYMCEQSLLNYLATELEGKVSKEDLEKLIKVGENVIERETVSVSKEANPEYSGDYKRLLPDSIKEFAQEIDEKLATIKVCDPAIGSGAFPVGMMSKIVKARAVLSTYIKDASRTIYGFKRDCIQNSLYGVDIDPSAVEIAKLRLWLSLVVDEDDIKQIKPLPNLDYKIMQGNSLLEEFEGIKLFNEKLLQTQIIDSNFLDPKNQIISELQSKLLKFYGINPQWMKKGEHKDKPQEVVDLETKLRKILKEGKKIEETSVEQGDLFVDVIRSRNIRDELENLHRKFFGETNKKNKDEIKRKIGNLEWELIQETLKEQNKVSAIKKLEEFKRSNVKPFFLWKLNFAEVFEEKGGFDVVIANPPYDVYQGHRKDEIEELSHTAMYPLAKGGKLNAYKLFLAKSIQLQKAAGILCEIFQNSFLADNSAKNIRKYFIEKENIIQIDSFPERDDINLRVFEGVKMSVCILLAKNLEINDYPIVLNIWNDKYMSIGKKLELTKNTLIKFDEINFTIPSTSNEEMSVLKKLAKFPKLIEYGRCYEGEINLTFHKKYLHKELDGNKPMIKGAAVQKWYIKKKMSQGEIEYLDAKKFLRDNRSPKTKHYTQKRLVMQGITGVDEKYRLKMTIIEGGTFCGNSVNYVLMGTNEVSYEYLLALLNSKLLNWYFKIFSTNSNVNGYEVNNFPVPKCSKLDQNPFINFVDKIFKITGIDNYVINTEKQAKVRDIEQKIDELVYKIYGLTDEEIKIVEAS